MARNPLVFRLLVVLQIVMEHLAHSAEELQRLYGGVALDATRARGALGRAGRNPRGAAAAVTCPTCGASFDSDLDLDWHVERAHRSLRGAWKCVRAGRPSETDARVAKLQRQIGHLKLLLAEQAAADEDAQKPAGDTKGRAGDAKERAGDKKGAERIESVGSENERLEGRLGRGDRPTPTRSRQSARRGARSPTATPSRAGPARWSERRPLPWNPRDGGTERIVALARFWSVREVPRRREAPSGFRRASTTRARSSSSRAGRRRLRRSRENRSGSAKEWPRGRGWSIRSSGTRRFHRAPPNP